MEKYEIQKLRDLPIEGVAEQLGMVVKRHKALCPFHADHHASLSFNTKRNSCRCYVCNFVNHCYAISAELLEKHGIPFDVMLPLIDETAAKVHQMAPKDAQTGPAVRYDENVIRNQSQLLKNNPLVKDIYDRMSMNIHRLSEE